MTPENRSSESGVRSVDRAVSILEMLAAVGSAGPTELSVGLDLHKSTIFRLLTTLEARGLVEPDDERGKYRLGNTVVQLAAGATRTRSLAEIGRSICRELAEEVGETVNLSVRNADHVVTVEHVVGSGAAVAARDWTGNRQPLHTTAAGKIFLAAMADREFEDFVASGLAAATQETITDVVTLREHLAQVRKLDYATTFEENEVGLSAVSVPVRALGDAVIAALTISGPAFRLRQDTMPGLLAALVPAAEQISWRCGRVKLA